ncbi:MAG: transcriptional repressor LexA [Myxococcota bacterium]|nr:transcriptional repressor LexA [Myxococcota bacterium]
MEDLSPRQQEIMEYVSACFDQRGIAPSYREIGDALGIRSTNGVADHVKALIRKGYLERVGGAGRARSLRMTTKAKGNLHEEATVGLPLLGRVAAGSPTLAVEDAEEIVRVDRSLVPAGKACFGLRVHGESMIEDGILDGDIVIVQKQPELRNGQTGVVMVDGDVTVKRVYKEKGLLRLVPANSSMEDILVDPGLNPEVVGKVIALIRPNIY